jgi:hypothetical protein
MSVKSIWKTVRRVLNPWAEKNTNDLVTVTLRAKDFTPNNLTDIKNKNTLLFREFEKSNSTSTFKNDAFAKDFVKLCTSKDSASAKTLIDYLNAHMWEFSEGKKLQYLYMDLLNKLSRSLTSARNSVVDQVTSSFRNLPSGTTTIVRQQMSMNATEKSFMCTATTGDQKNYWAMKITEDLAGKLISVQLLMFNWTGVASTPAVVPALVPARPPAPMPAGPALGGGGPLPVTPLPSPVPDPTSPKGPGSKTPAGPPPPPLIPTPVPDPKSPKGSGSKAPAGPPPPVMPVLVVQRNDIADFTISIFNYLGTPTFLPELKKALPQMSAGLINDHEDQTHRYKWDTSSIKDYKSRFPTNVLRDQFVTLIQMLYSKTGQKNKEDRVLLSRCIMFICGVSLQDNVVFDCHARKLSNWTVVHGLESMFAIFHDGFKNTYTIVYAGKLRPVNGLLTFDEL